MCGVSGEMGTVYSLRLLHHEVAREWLLAREEPKLPRSFMDSSLALRHRVFIGSKPKFVDQLFKPIAVVNGVLIGYVSWTIPKRFTSSLLPL